MTIDYGYDYDDGDQKSRLSYDVVHLENVAVTNSRGVSFFQVQVCLSDSITFSLAGV